MVYDPNSTIPSHHEVRVTMRGVRITQDGSPVQVSTRSDFIAPDLSPVSTLALELDKGLAGWTDTDNKPADVRPSHIRRAERNRRIQATADANETTCGETIIRKAPTAPLRKLNRTGPRRRIAN